MKATNNWQLQFFGTTDLFERYKVHDRRKYSYSCFFSFQFSPLYLKKFPTPHTQCWYINLFGLDPPPQTCSCNTRRLHFSLCVILRLVFTQVILVLEHNTTKIASMFRPTTTNISGVGERGSSILSALFQTWKKAQTCGHCPWKFLRIVEISGLWKIDNSYFGIKLMNYENFFLTIEYLAYLKPMNQ